MSEAERVFAQSDSREIAIKIVDSTNLSRLVDGIKIAAEEAAQLSQPGLLEPLRQPSAVGYLRFEPSEQRAEASLLVADRFVISILSRGLPDSREVRRIVENLDYAGLSKLR
jgi:hypothetical protein